MRMPDEHQAFQVLTDSLGKASDAAMILAHWRPDQAQLWQKLAEAFKVNQEAAFRLAGEGVLHSRTRN